MRIICIDPWEIFSWTKQALLHTLCFGMKRLWRQRSELSKLSRGSGTAERRSRAGRVTLMRGNQGPRLRVSFLLGASSVYCFYFPFQWFWYCILVPLQPFPFLLLLYFVPLSWTSTHSCRCISPHFPNYSLIYSFEFIPLEHNLLYLLEAKLLPIFRDLCNKHFEVCFSCCYLNVTFLFLTPSAFPPVNSQFY